jgi:hypothetical protein
MAMTLADMRLRVRKYVDDVAQKRWDTDGNNTDVDGALTTAIAEAFSLVVAAGASSYRSTVNVTASTTGLVDLSAVKPLRLYAVRLTSGASPYQSFAEVLPTTQGQWRCQHNAAETLSITCIPSAVFPASSGVPVIWGVSGLDVPELDQLACAIAASQLKADEGEDNPALERRKAELRAAVMGRPDMTSWAVSDPYRSSPFGRPLLYYVALNPNALQLVER